MFWFQARIELVLYKILSVQFEAFFFKEDAIQELKCCVILPAFGCLHKQKLENIQKLTIEVKIGCPA